MARPPKLKDMITIEDVEGKMRQVMRRDAVLKLVEYGVPYKAAALRAGIAESTFHAWCAKGRKAKSGVYRSFVDDLAIANGKAEVALTLQLRVHAKKDYKACLAILRARWSENWLPKTIVEATVTTPTGVPSIALVGALGTMTPEQLAAIGGCDLDAMDGLGLPPTKTPTDPE